MIVVSAVPLVSLVSVAISEVFTLVTIVPTVPLVSLVSLGVLSEELGYHSAYSASGVLGVSSCTCEVLWCL